MRSNGLVWRRLPLFVALSLPAMAQEGMLKPVTAADVKTLSSQINRALLPEHSSHVEVATKQVFRLSAAGQVDLLLVPVVFWHGEPWWGGKDLADRNRCGVFVVPADGGPQSFVYTITGDQDLAVSQCGELKAVRRTPHDGARPALKLTYRTFDPPRFEDTADILLKWDGKAGTYKVVAPTP